MKSSVALYAAVIGLLAAASPGCVVHYGEGPVVRPADPVAPPADFAEVQARLEALVDDEVDVDRRDRIDAALDLLRMARAMTPQAQARVLAYLQRVVAIEERAQPMEAPALFAAEGGGVGQAGVRIGPPIEEEDLGGIELVEPPPDLAPPPVDDAPAGDAGDAGGPPPGEAAPAAPAGDAGGPPPGEAAPAADAGDAGGPPPGEAAPAEDAADAGGPPPGEAAPAADAGDAGGPPPGEAAPAEDAADAGGPPPGEAAPAVDAGGPPPGEAAPAGDAGGPPPGEAAPAAPAVDAGVAGLGGDVAPDPVALARAALDAGDPAAALSALEPCGQVACAPDADAVRQQAVDAFVHAERERAGALFVRARSEADAEERIRRLREARDLLAELLDRFPDAAEADAIRRNIDTVQRELEAQR